MDTYLKIHFHLMRKNSHDKILREKSKEQHLSTLPMSYSYIYIYIYTHDFLVNFEITYNIQPLYDILLYIM